jgi:hypothetical protein
MPSGKAKHITVSKAEEIGQNFVGLEIKACNSSG